MYVVIVYKLHEQRGFSCEKEPCRLPGTFGLIGGMSTTYASSDNKL